MKWEKRNAIKFPWQKPFYQICIWIWPLHEATDMRYVTRKPDTKRSKKISEWVKDAHRNRIGTTSHMQNELMGHCKKSRKRRASAKCIWYFNSFHFSTHSLPFGPYSASYLDSFLLPSSQLPTNTHRPYQQKSWKSAVKPSL